MSLRATYKKKELYLRTRLSNNSKFVSLKRSSYLKIIARICPKFKGQRWWFIYRGLPKAPDGIPICHQNFKHHWICKSGVIPFPVTLAYCRTPFPKTQHELEISDFQIYKGVEVTLIGEGEKRPIKQLFRKLFCNALNSWVRRKSQYGKGLQNFEIISHPVKCKCITRSIEHDIM